MKPAILKWFDRRFDFSFGTDQFAAIVQRLESGPGRVREAVDRAAAPALRKRPEGKWSVKEHIGHLGLLEPLWRTRLREIRDGAPSMSPADLSNTATSEAGFNSYPMEALLDGFAGERARTLDFLRSVTPDGLSRALPHPRLGQLMRLIDLMFFVAEHDDHHLAAISDFLSND